MSLVRVLRTAQVTMKHTFYVDETPTSASGAVTTSLKRLDGTVVASGTGTLGTPGEYTYVLPAQASLDSLTLDWSGSVGGAAITVRDYVEIVGEHLFGLAEARAAHSSLASTTTYPSALLAAKRIEVEQEFETICGQAWVPRFAREVLSGNGYDRIGLEHSMLRAVRAVSIAGVALSAPDVALIGYSDHGVLTRPGGAIWPAGLNNIIVEYEHGNDYPPEPIREAGILRLRSRIAMTSSGIPDRAISYATADGGTYRLSTPSRERTGIPEIDGVLARPGYTRQPRAVFA